MSTDEREARLEDAFATLTRLAESIDGHPKTEPGWIKSLAEAQRRTEEARARLAKRNEDEGTKES